MPSFMETVMSTKLQSGLVSIHDHKLFCSEAFTTCSCGPQLRVVKASEQNIVSLLVVDVLCMAKCSSFADQSYISHHVKRYSVLNYCKTRHHEDSMVSITTKTSKITMVNTTFAAHCHDVCVLLSGIVFWFLLCNHCEFHFKDRWDFFQFFLLVWKFVM